MKSTKAGFDFYYQYVGELNDEALLRSDYWELSHDTWSLYSYGQGYKVVYIKYGCKASGSKFEGIKPLSAKEESERFSQSLSRTKSTIFELAICNEFTYFCTFTQDENLVGDRFDLHEFRKDLAQFVRNQNRGRQTKIKYLLIPEQHKNGAWHMHGLLSGLTSADLREFSLKEKLPNAIRKELKAGKKVYNWEKYSKKFGYFTASPINSHVACSKYITKYITKDVLKNNLKSGAHSYYASQGLQRRERIFRTDFEICPITEWDFENNYVKVAWFDSKEDLEKVKSQKTYSTALPKNIS